MITTAHSDAWRECLSTRELCESSDPIGAQTTRIAALVRVQMLNGHSDAQLLAGAPLGGFYHAFLQSVRVTLGTGPEPTN